MSVDNGIPTTVTGLPTFIGLYGIACPTATTCYAVGYDTQNGIDAVTTITNGVAGAPVEVPDSVEWLNAITCPSSTQCYAAGLVNYEPSIVPVSSGVPGTPVEFGQDFYMNGIACTSVGNCLAVGEDQAQTGVVFPLVDGAAGTPQTLAGTEYLYGVACASEGDCLLAGASTAGADGYSTGVVSHYTGGGPHAPVEVPGTNGLGQVVCGETVNACLTVGAAHEGSWAG